MIPITDYSTLFQTALTMLSAIITGGFVLVFVEIGNRKNRENDKYETEFRPFMRKFSAYLRFMNWCTSHLEYPHILDEHEKPFKKLVDEISGYGGRLIVSGGDMGIGYFSAERLERFTLDINNIWYWHDKMNPCRINWDSRFMGTEEFIKKELTVLNPVYNSINLNVDMVAKVSGEFYTEIYQPIAHLPFNHEARNEQYRRQTLFVLLSAVWVLALLVSMLFWKVPMLALQISTAVVIGLLLSSLLILGIDINKQIRWHYKIQNCLFGCIKKTGRLMKKWKNGQVITFWCTLAMSGVIVALYFAQRKWGLAGIFLSFLGAEFLLQIFKKVYQRFARKSEFCPKLVEIITRCWICYNILNSIIITGLLYVYLLAAAKEQWLGLSTNWYFVIILGLSCVISFRSINALKQENKDGRSSSTSIIYAYAPRFVIMLAFVVFYCIKYINDTTPEELVPELFVVYLGVDRIYNMMMGAKYEANDSYKSLYEDTEKWIKKERKLE